MSHARQSAILLLTLGVVYLSSFPGAFHFDDYALLLDNPAVSGQGFRYASFLDHFGGRPLTLWSFHVNHLLSGRDPFAYHLVNVLLHGLATLAFFLLLSSPLFAEAGILTRTTTERGPLPGAAFFAAMLFALHPLQTQAVNYVWSRSMLLMAFWGLAATLLSRRHPLVALLFFQLAIWSRTEGLVFLPLIVLANPKEWMRPAVLAAINVVLFGLGMAVHAPEGIGWSHPDPFGYWISQPVAFFKYLALMLWPRGQTIDHDFGPVAPILGLAAGVLLAAVLAGVWRLRERFPEGLHGLLWALAFLAPSGLIPNTDGFNESRAYLAVGGFAILGVGLFWRIADKKPLSWLAPVVGTLVVAAFAAVTISRNALWSDDLLIWREAARVSPNKARVQYNLGFALAQRRQIEPAEQAFRLARSLNPSDDLSYAALGYCAEIQHRNKEALAFYEQALTLNPNNDYAREGVERMSSDWSDSEATHSDGIQDESSRIRSEPTGS